jgi:hypothetical protein
MAKAANQHTPGELSLDDLLNYLMRRFRWREDSALYQIDQKISAGDLPLRVRHYLDEKLQGENVVISNYYRNYLGLEIKDSRVQVITKYFALVPGEFHYTVLEQDAQFVDWLPQSPASQTALDQEPKGQAGPDPFKTGAGGRPAVMHLIMIEAERRIADKEVTPTLGELTKFGRDLADWWNNEKRRTFNPPGAPVGAKSVENAVRNVWNAVLGAQN